MQVAQHGQASSPLTLNSKQGKGTYLLFDSILDAQRMPLDSIIPQKGLNCERRHYLPTFLFRTNNRPYMRLDLHINVPRRALHTERVVPLRMQRAPQLQRHLLFWLEQSIRIRRGGCFENLLFLVQDTPSTETSTRKTDTTLPRATGPIVRMATKDRDWLLGDAGQERECIGDDGVIVSWATLVSGQVLEREPFKDFETDAAFQDTRCWSLPGGGDGTGLGWRRARPVLEEEVIVCGPSLRLRVGDGGHLFQLLCLGCVVVVVGREKEEEGKRKERERE